MSTPAVCRTSGDLRPIGPAATWSRRPGPRPATAGCDEVATRWCGCDEGPLDGRDGLGEERALDGRAGPGVTEAARCRPLAASVHSVTRAARPRRSATRG